MCRTLPCLVVACMLAPAAPSLAGVEWSPSTGSLTGFSYTNGRSAEGLFGVPVAAGNFFSFFPDGMKLVGANGDAATASDTVAVRLLADSGAFFGTISAGVVGDFSLLGPSSIDLVGTIRVKNNLTSAVLSASLLVTPDVPFTTVSSGAGIVSGIASIAVPAGWSDVQIEYSVTPSVSSLPGGVGLIDVKVAQIAATTVIPEPTVALLLPAMALLARRR